MILEKLNYLESGKNSGDIYNKKEKEIMEII